MAAVLLNIGLFRFHSICIPVLNCHSCPTSVFACPVGVIGNFAGLGLIPLGVIGLTGLVGVVVGRFLCGWVCPFGLMQELLYKVPYVKFEIPRWTRHIKYVILGGLVIAVPLILTTESALYFCRLCPVATIESAIPWAIINGTANMTSLAIRLMILFGIIILVMGHRRMFCKTMCPLGAMLSVLNRFSGIFPWRNQEKCVDCGACNRVCPMETQKRQGRFGAYEEAAEECISCLECREKCPTSAIRIWGG
jgi:polyferredoxin